MKPKDLSTIQIREKYQKLLSGKGSPQQRGYELEKLIYAILQNEGLEPKASYTAKGEQIDGSFFWFGQTFLLEAKWVKDPLPASSIYAFKGKLDGKFHTTSGVYISVNGYSKDLEEALKIGKSLNVLLFDKDDIPLLFNGDVSFTEMLKFKLRQAADTGSLQVPYKLVQEAKNISNTKPTKHENTELHTSSGIVQIDDLLIFVEGKSDTRLVNNLLEPIEKRYSFTYRIESLNGISNLRMLPSLLNLYSEFNSTKGVIVVLDSDLLNTEWLYLIQNVEKQFENSSISVRTKFLYLNHNLKDKLTNTLSRQELKSELIFEELDLFIDQIAQDYYDPTIDIPQTALKSVLAHLKWNYKKGVIEVHDQYDPQHSSTIESIEELVFHLEEEIGQALNAEMPMDWLKEHDFDHADEVREYLIKNYSKQIDRLGWNSNKL